MNIDTLNYFIKISECKNLSTASKIHHISQSALSQQLSKLESTLNSKLLVRSNKGVDLTPEGEILFKHAKAIIDSYDKLIEDMDNLKSGKNFLSVDATESLTSVIISDTFNKFKKYFKHHKLKINTVDSFSPLNLSKHLCDFYIGYVNSTDLMNIDSYEIGLEELILVAHKSFPKDSVASYELANLPIIDRFNKPVVKYSLDENLRIDHTNKLNIVCTTNSNLAALEATQSFNAVTFLPKNLLNLFPLSEYKRIEITDLKIQLPIYLICSHDFSKNNPSLIKFFKNNLKNFFA